MTNNSQQRPAMPQTPKENVNIDAEKLYDVTHDVAKDVLSMRKERTMQTKKMMVIGQAMVSQKDALGEIIAAQKNNDAVMRSEFDETLKTQTTILKSIDDTHGGINSIQKSCGVQNELVRSLQTLKERHAQVMLECQQAKHRQIEQAVGLRKDLEAFQKMLVTADIDGKCVQIQKTMESIMDTIEQYYKLRQQQRETLKQHIETTTALLVQFQKHIEEQGSTINHIDKNAVETNNTAVNIDKKLSILLTQQEKKATTALPTLEEAFGNSKEKKTPVPKKTSEPVAQPEPQPVEEPVKKKSVLKSLFGGK